MLDEYARRREIVNTLLSEIPGISYQKPEGAFYYFIDISSLIGRSYKGRPITDDSVFASILLEAYHVVVVPGTFFEGDGYIRISYASSEEEIRTALKLLNDFIGDLT
jgi:aspartate aminotransferase